MKELTNKLISIHHHNGFGQRLSALRITHSWTEGQKARSNLCHQQRKPFAADLK